jgi:PST family polysaccharide transporter
MLGQMATAKSLGVYSVAVKLSEVFNIIPTVISISLLPVLVKKYQEDEKAFLETMQGVYDLMAVLWFLVAIFISPFSSWIVDIVYGEAYAGAGNVLALYIWSQFGSNFGVARALYINVKNLFRISLIISICGAVTNIALNLWLIPRYQEMGATVATLITYFIAVIFMNLFFVELRKLIPLILKSVVIPQSIFRLTKMFMARKLT